MVTKQQLDAVERYADTLWGKVGLDIEFTRHFHDRVNDVRNNKPITSAELVSLFRKSYKKYGKTIANLGRDAQAVIKDMQNDINMPFVIQLDRNGQLDLVAKTIMRKKDFKTSNKKFAVESGAGEEGTDTLSYKYKQDTPYQLTNGKTMKREKFIPKEIIDEDVPAFMGAVAQAAKDGKKEFEFGGKTYKVTLNKKVADKIAKNMDEAEDGTITLKTHSAFAAERLKKKLRNKFFDRRDQFIVKGSDLHIPDVSNIVRIAKKQPEIKESTDLEEAPMSRGVKTAASQIYYLERSLRVGSMLNKAVNTLLDGKYDADFKKMEKSIGEIVDVWIEIERDYGMTESTALEEASASDVKKILNVAKKYGADVTGNTIDFGMGAVVDVSIEKGKIKFDSGLSSGVSYFKNVKDAIKAFESIDLEEADDTELDKKSLDAMIKNPDPKRAKEYGGKAGYVKMLMKKRKSLGEEKDDFKPHMMYNPKTGESEKAEKPEDHERLSAKGWTHEEPELDEADASDFAKLSDKDIDKLIDIFKDVGRKSAQPILKSLERERKGRDIKEDVEALQEADGWIAQFHGRKLEITKKDADSLYAAKLFAIDKLRIPKSKQWLLSIKPAYNESVELEESTELYNDSGVIINQYSAGAGKMGYQITVGRKYIQLNKKQLIKVLQGLGIEGVRGQLRKGGVIKESNVAELEEALKCPPAAGNVELNTKNRDATIKKYMYGPLNVKEPGDYWEKVAKKWDTSVEAAKKSLCENCVAFDISPRMKDCMPGKTSDDEGELGYCWMHHFKCHSARTCTTWAKGGPIKDDKTSEEWQNKSMNESTDLQEATLPFKELEKAWIRTKGNEKAREKLVKKHNLKPIISNVRPGAIKLGPLNDLKAKTSDHTMAGLDAEGELIFVTNNPVKIYYPSNTKDRPRGEELKEDVSIETQRLRKVVQLSLNESDIARIDDFIVEENIELNMTPSKIQSAYKKYISELNAYIA